MPDSIGAKVQHNMRILARTQEARNPRATALPPVPMSPLDQSSYKIRVGRRRLLLAGEMAEAERATRHGAIAGQLRRASSKVEHVLRGLRDQGWGEARTWDAGIRFAAGDLGAEQAESQFLCQRRTSPVLDILFNRR